MQRRLTLVTIAACLAAGAGGAALASDQPPPRPDRPDESDRSHGRDKDEWPGKRDRFERPGHGGAKRGEKALFGVLLGRNEIGQDGSRRAGDPDGRGSATATIDGTKLCFGLTARDIGEPTMAHIHRGKRRENGPPVVTLTQPSAGDPGASSGCVDVDAALAAELVKTPHKFYWNIHTKDFPDGAIRGQVFATRH